ncbi:outer membrane beta-barrel protein [Sphingobacterium yanglingense]|uniref:Outer membrane protein n=1 Tax=Sphingobacterium yanglingense TaxID=1437280 RepID=A0A4R6WP32_9SPHI|nr:outer membrane beta-barrel protein [Sphingobacterium yanglingense]TDQ82845.1 outer membrane protein [Sphingobacterium yanglingense]
MRRTLLTIAVTAGLTSMLQAQEFGLNKGDILLEGQINIHSSKDKNADLKNSHFGFSPKVGYFLSDKFAIGVDLGILKINKEELGANNNIFKSKYNEYKVGAFGRYYFLNIGERFKAYSELNAAYLNGKITMAAGYDDVKSNHFAAKAGIGANFFLTKNVALGYSFGDVIGFNTTKIGEDGTKSRNNFYMNVNSFNNFFETGQFSLTFKL